MSPLPPLENTNKMLNDEWIVQTVQAKFQQSSLKEIINIVSEPLNLGGDHFTSTLSKIKVEFTLVNGGKTNVSLISKLNKTVEGSEMTDFFNNRIESGIYLNVLRQMESLMVEFDDGREIPWPKLYGHIPYSVLLLEDLGAKLYETRPRDIWFESDHTLLGLRALGRFHAMSKILLQRGFVDEEYKNKYSFARKNAFFDQFIAGSSYMLSETMIGKKGHWNTVELSETWGNLLRKRLPSLGDYFEAVYMNYDERFEVLNHGDFRCSNMLFKSMEYSDSPVDVKFLDFQLCHTNSFAWDIIYFLSLSVDPSYRRDHRNELLEAYQQSLADNLKYFNWEGYVPTIDDVINETDRLSFVQFIYMCSITSVLSSTIVGTMVAENMMSHPIEEIFNQLAYSDERYVNGIVGDFERAVNLKII